MARWTRALAALPFTPGPDVRLLDLGCAFGFSTRMFARRGYSVVGVDGSPSYIERARRGDPKGIYLVADAAHVSLPDASFDGVVFLDVLEHLPDEEGAIREVARLLKPGGTLVLSVPRRGPLAWLDSLNLYAQFVRLTHHGRFPPEIQATGRHQHYTVERLRALLGANFTIDRTWRTGLGLVELLHLPALVVFRWLLPIEPLYGAAAFLYYTGYLVEDVLPLGPLGYHLMARATRVSPSEPTTP